MTFLNPLVLFGLAAAAIPIIIHLLNLRKLKTIEFSTLRFLKELQKTRMRRIRIRQWLLLALRTLLVVCLVFAFSRPALKGSIAGTIGSHARSTVVILLDDSPSMGVRGAQGVLFAQAKQLATHVLGLLREGDEAYIIPMSDVNRRDVFTPLFSPGDGDALLEHVTVSLERVPFGDALRVAAKILATSANFNQEVYLITDGQASQFEPVVDSAALFEDRVKVFFVDVGNESPDNAGIASAEVRSAIIMQNKPVEVRSMVRNAARLPMKNLVLSAYFDGTRVVQQSLDISPGGSETVTLSLIPKRRGILHGYLQIEDDILEADNRRHFVVNVPENIRVLMAGGTPADTRLPQLALTPGGDGIGQFTVTSIGEAQLTSTDISRFDVLMLCGVRDFSSAETDRITAFVKAGGGLVLFPGVAMDPTSYNQTLLRALGVPAIEENASPLQPESADETSFLSFRTVDVAHPLFSGLFETSSTGRENPARGSQIESPRVYRHVRFSPGRSGQPIITLTDGSSFLTEYVAGSGRVLAFAVEAGLTWSDFPVKGLFVPLVHRATMYLAELNQQMAPAIVGRSLTLTARLPSEVGDPYVMRSPQGIEERVAPQFRAGSGLAVFELPRTSETGVYELRRAAPSGRDTRPLAAIAVNLAPEESDLRAIDEQTLSSRMNELGIGEGQLVRIGAISRFATAILESRFGVELWKHFLLIALALALAEMLIGREPKPEPVKAG